MILEYQGNAIEQRELDGYVNLTQMAKPFNRKVKDWHRTDSSKAYVEAVSALVKKCPDDLLVYQHGNIYERSTWAHPLVAIAFAQWLNPHFHVWCNLHIKQIIEEQANSAPISQPKLNIYARRVQIASNWDIPVGYWCVFHECSLLANKIGETYNVGDYDLIDGSVGKCWSNYRKGKPWIFPPITFQPIFGDTRDAAHIEAKAYRNEELIYFRDWLENSYKLSNLPKYLDRKYGEIVKRS